MVTKVEFKYNEPMIGEIEIEGDSVDFIQLIQEEFPEAIDIEIVRVTDAS